MTYALFHNLIAVPRLLIEPTIGRLVTSQLLSERYARMKS